MPPDDVLSQSSDEDEVSRANIDVTWPSPALQPPNFTWGSCSGEVFCTKINLAYEEVVHWRRNLFQVPSGSTGKAFVSELARLFQAYADSSSLECIAMKALDFFFLVRGGRWLFACFNAISLERRRFSKIAT